MSDNVCPKCGKLSTMSIGTFYVNDFCQCYTIADEVANLQSEIARLKAELTNGQELLAYAMAEGERLKAELEKAQEESKLRKSGLLFSEIIRLRAAIEQDEKEIVMEHKRYRAMVEQRDEARRWAGKYYRLYLIERQNYLDTFLDGDEWDEV